MLRRFLPLSTEYARTGADGSGAIFFQRPVSAVFLTIALFFLVTSLFATRRIGGKVLEVKEQD